MREAGRELADRRHLPRLHHLVLGLRQAVERALELRDPLLQRHLGQSELLRHVVEAKAELAQLVGLARWQDDSALARAESMSGVAQALDSLGLPPREQG